MFMSTEQRQAVSANAATNVGLVGCTGVVEVDANLGFSRANPVFLHMLGYTLKDLARRSVFSITHPTDVDAMERAHRQLIAGDTAARYEVRYIAKSGAGVPCIVDVHCGNRDTDGWPLWFRSFATPIAVS